MEQDSREDVALFPACAGVILDTLAKLDDRSTFPRVWGGDPLGGLAGGDFLGLFPACAGVILKVKNFFTPDLSFPRVCGGDPTAGAIN